MCSVVFSFFLWERTRHENMPCSTKISICIQPGYTIRIIVQTYAAKYDGNTISRIENQFRFNQLQS